MLPCPYPRALGAFDKLSVNFLGVYKGDISVVRLGLLIDEPEDALSARKTHHNGVYLV